MELPSDAVEASAGEQMLRCFRVWQSERLERQMVPWKILRRWG
jgi:hypothetical protein